MTDLRQAAQQALDAWDDPMKDLKDLCVAMDTLRTALEQQQAEPVSHAVIAGALFDFMGWLTTRKERLVLSSTDNASPAVESITEFAKMRGLSLDDAKVQDWNTSLPQQQAEPVAWMDKHGNIDHGLDAILEPEGWKPLYTTPPQRQWVGLTDEEVNRESAPIAQQMKLAFHAGMYVAQKILKEKNT